MIDEIKSKFCFHDYFTEAEPALDDLGLLRRDFVLYTVWGEAVFLWFLCQGTRISGCTLKG